MEKKARPKPVAAAAAAVAAAAAAAVVAVAIQVESKVVNLLLLVQEIVQYECGMSRPANVYVYFATMKIGFEMYDFIQVDTLLFRWVKIVPFVRLI